MKTNKPTYPANRAALSFSSEEVAILERLVANDVRDHSMSRYPSSPAYVDSVKRLAAKIERAKQSMARRRASPEAAE